MARKQTDDPALSGGTSVDAGDPHTRGMVTYDTRNAVMVEQVEVSVAHLTRGGEPAEDAVAMVIRGRRNRPADQGTVKPRESIEHLNLMSWDAAADVVAELMALAKRDGFDLGPMIMGKWMALNAEGLTQEAPRDPEGEPQS